MPTSIAGKRIDKQRGFSYVLVLAAVVIVGIIAEAAHLSTWRVMQADREAELLFRGQAFRRAIQSYYELGGRFPSALMDLLDDPRFPNRRHIRALYSDPMAGGEDSAWVLVRSGDGGIRGVVSSNKNAPLKLANFPEGFEKFEGAKSYSDWIFEYVPPPVNRQYSGDAGGVPPSQAPRRLHTY